MDKYVTGLTIKKLREERGLTQLELADKLGVSDKTISKWENGRGYPDITLLQPLAGVFALSLQELFEGEVVKNQNVAGNIQKGNFYVCPLCGNVVFSLGEAVIECHGLALKKEVAREDEGLVKIDKIENEYHIYLDHPMTKDNYISFVCALGDYGLQMDKKYPESACESYFRISGVRKIYYYSNKDGLFFKKL